MIASPRTGLALGNMDFSNLFTLLKPGEIPGPYPTLADAQAAGAVTINYGLFVNSIVSFLIIAAVVFFGIIRPIMRMQASKKAAEVPEPTMKECPFCYTNIPMKATRCPNCTSPLTGD